MSTSSTEDLSAPNRGAGGSEEPEPIDLLGYLRNLGRHWLAGLITAVVVAALLLGYGALKGSDTVGSTWARAHVMVTLPDPRTDAQSRVLAQSVQYVMATYVAVDDNQQILQQTAKNLGDGTSVETLRASTSAFWGGGGQIIALYATGTDLQQAEKRANAYAQAFVSESAKFMPAPVKGLSPSTLTLVQQAGASPSNPSAQAGGSKTALLKSPIVSVVIAIVVGAAVMAGAELVSSRRRRD
ncbi:chain-length determining protein [Acidipropionibacterium jensenii]|uniref:Chain-length determining protein n=1 Tax=Acidipropionibacterium jensenii TaxID=1749 RepID=A0A3T0S1W3_9ACTN|nr:chain-length determining protein [Acidipropionibacterium jensenii]AZZ40349.1 chain-length determining protein [Acidipropionibacterium jensenii]